MLAMSERVRPCSARICWRSFGRWTRTRPSSTRTSIPSGSGRSRVPFGPFTTTWPLFRDTSTPLGRGIGSFPIRDMVCLPDVTDDFTAHVLAAGLAVRHQAAAGAQDGDSHPVLNSRYSTGRCVNAQPRLADPLELLEHRLPLGA